MSEQFNNANWLIKSIEQRAQTLLKVASAIVNKQIEFFDKGRSYLKPLTLKEVANELSIHESTVSRVTTNKFMSTPQGLFEMKFFFNSKLIDSHAEHSSLSIKHIIREIINNETLTLTDQKIADLLKIYP